MTRKSSSIKFNMCIISCYLFLANFQDDYGMLCHNICVYVCMCVWVNEV